RCPSISTPFPYTTLFRSLMLDQFALPETIIERFNLFKAEVERRGRTFDPMTVAVARAFYVAKDAADKASAVERRLAATRRMTGRSEEHTSELQSPDPLVC